MATLTVYAYDQTNGSFYYSGSKLSWATLRGAASATGGVGNCYTLLTSDSGKETYAILYRSLLSFDTSALTAGSTITATTISLYGLSKANSLGTPTANITDISPEPADPTSFVNDDFNNINDTKLMDSDYTYAGWNTSGYNTGTLNASGITAVNKTGYTCLMVRLGWDISNTAPTYIKSVGSEMDAHGPSFSGTTYDPYIYIEYSGGGGSVELECKSIACSASTSLGMARDAGLTGKSNNATGGTSLTANRNAGMGSTVACTAGTTLKGQADRAIWETVACNAGTKITGEIDRELRNTVAATAGTTLKCQADRGLGITVPGVSTVTGMVEIDRQLVLSAAAVSTVTARGEKDHGLWITVIGDSEVSPTLSVTAPPGQIALQATIDGRSVTVFSMQVDRALGVSPAAISTVTGPLSRDVGISLTAAAVTGTKFDAERNQWLGITIDGRSTVTEMIERDRQLALTAAATAGVSDFLAADRALSDIINALSATILDLSVVTPSTGGIAHALELTAAAISNSVIYLNEDFALRIESAGESGVDISLTQTTVPRTAFWFEGTGKRKKHPNRGAIRNNNQFNLRFRRF